MNPARQPIAVAESTAAALSAKFEFSVAACVVKTSPTRLIASPNASERISLMLMLPLLNTASGAVDRNFDKPYCQGENMKHMLHLITVFAVWLSASLTALAQDASSENGVKAQAEKIVAGTRDKVEEIAQEVEKSEKAHEVSAGILKPVYALAETFSFPAFHWIAFSLMVAGVVSFAPARREQPKAKPQTLR